MGANFLTAQTPFYHGIIYVTQTGAGTHSGDSWANATSSIDTAQALAQEHNAVVWVAAGTYYGDTLSDNAFTMVEGVNVYGGFAGNEPADYDLSLRDFETNETILDGDSARRVLYQPSSSFIDVIIPNGFDIPTTWDGFTIQNGQALEYGGGAYLDRNGILSHCSIKNSTANNGGGIYAIKNSIVVNCEVSDNVSNVSGGGIYADGYSEISNCRVFNNISNDDGSFSAAGGGGVNANYHSTIKECDIYNNISSSRGGGVMLAGYYTAAITCHIYGNTAPDGGGVYVNDARVGGCHIYNNTAFYGGGVEAKNASIDTCYIYKNTGYEGGGLYSSSSTDTKNSYINHNTASWDGGGVYMKSGNLTNCLVANNTSEFSGGGVSLNGGSIITNSTIVRNEAEYGSAGVTSYYGDDYMINSVVWGNAQVSSTIIYSEEYWPQSLYSAIEKEYLGETNIPLLEDSPYQPLFVNPSQTAGASDSTENVDWHLQPNSILINRGWNMFYGDTIYFDSVSFFRFWDIDSVDLDGEPRIRRDTVDIGCYESDFYSAALPAVNYTDIIYVTPMGAGSKTGENWSNATSSIEFANLMAAMHEISQVWVAAGIYYGDTMSPFAFKMHEGVNVYGGFAGDEPANYDLSLRDFQTNASILDGQNMRQVLDQSFDFREETTWDGFEIRNGRAFLPGGAWIGSNGVLSHCNIHDNEALWYYGGVYLNEAKIVDCNIHHNVSITGGGIGAFQSIVRNCVIHNNIVSPNDEYDSQEDLISGAGVVSRNSLISNCLISNNTAEGESSTGGGLISFGDTIVNSTIVHNTASDGAGVVSDYYGNGDVSILTNSLLWGNETADGTPSNLSGSVTCYYSAIEGGFSGDSIVTLNAENPPLFVNPSLTAGADDSTTNVDWHLQNGSVCVNRGNNAAVIDSFDFDGTARIKRDTVDLGCYESDYYSVPIAEYDSIIYVTVTGAGTHSGNSWANATSSIEEAQTLAQTYNAVVWVAAGTYYGATTASNAFTMRDGVSVYGGFAGDEPANYDLSQRDFEVNATILDGQNVRRVLCQPFTFNKQTTWNGFTIRNGRISGDGGGAYLLQGGRLLQCKVMNNISTSGNGGGIYCNNTTVAECDIVANSGYRSGGGIYAWASIVTGCSIVENITTAGSGPNYSPYGGGGIYASGSTVNNCRISINTSNGYGGGVHLNESNAQGCEIVGNVGYIGGGVYLSTYGSKELTHCIISGNRSSGNGGGICLGGGTADRRIKDCLISNNSSNSVCGGVFGNGNLVNTTVVRNSSMSSDGAGVNGNSSTTLRNCIVWGNEQNGMPNNLNGSSIVCSHSAVEGGYPGTDMVMLDDNYLPLFVNPSLTAGAGDSTANVDWHLQNGSVCVNRGDNTFVTDSLGLDGTARIKRDTVDLGCYESDYYSIPMTEYDSIIYVTVTGAGTHSGNNWANATSSIEEAQTLAQTYNAVVWVAAGTYYGATTASNAFTMRDGVSVYGGFAGDEPANYDLSQRDFEVNATILDGQNVRRVLCQPFTFNKQTTWNGFTIRNGRISGDGGGAYLLQGGRLLQCKVMNNISTSGKGGGIYCNNTTVRDCDVMGNTAQQSGGGIYAWQSVVAHCRAEENAALSSSNSLYSYGGGGISASYSIVTNCVALNNTSNGYGGGAYLNESNALDCEIVGNVAYIGGGVYMSTYGSKELSHCVISGNRSSGNGGGVYFGSGTADRRIKDCLISNNSSNSVCGGVFGGGNLVNTTVVRNSSISSDGAGVYGSGSTILTNCIVWGNERNGESNNLGGNYSCSFSAVENGGEGDSIVVLNDINPPFFLNPSLIAGADDSTANVDWHLQNGSVCVNRGSNTAVTDSLDLDGTARIKRDTVDLGCYESDYYSVPVLYCSTVYSEFSDTVCDNYVWNGQTYTQSGNYTQSFELPNGCDSVVTLHLTVNHSVTTYDYLTICENEVPYTYGDTIFEVGTPQLSITNFQFSTQQGCDSIVTLHLTSLPSTVGEFMAMTPTNNYPITSYPIRFTWDAVENASDYDLYVWPVGESQPQEPTASHIHGTQYMMANLPNHHEYQWFMKAYNACDTSVSTIRQFSLNVTPALTVTAGNPVDFGEVPLNSTRNVYFQVHGTALDSVISYQISGADASSFALSPSSSWDSLAGGGMQLTFHPTMPQNEYTAQMTFQSDSLVKTITVKGYLSDYLIFTTYVDTNVYAMDSEIPIHGRVTNPLNEPLAGLEVEVYVSVMDYVRTLPATSDANGQFTVMFTPQHSEAGYYTVGSRRAGGNSSVVHDDFNIPGMMLVSSDWILWEPTIDQPDTGVIAVRNRSQIPLTNIQVTPLSLPNGCTVQFIPLNLTGMATGNLQYIVSGSELSTGVNYEEVRLNALSDEGAAMSFSAWYYCIPQRADLDVTPTSLITTMTRGKSKVVDFKIYNNGTGPTGNIYVSLPDLPWMSVVGSDTLPSLAVHDSAYISIRLSADSNTALVRYTGNFAITCERGEGVSIPYDITAISDSTGTLVVDVTDEYTWNTNNGHGPHLADAKVIVRGYYSLETVATGVTDVNGLFVVNDLPEGYYKLIVRADRHAEYQGVLLITAGDTNRQDIFIQFQAIAYSWEVVPTEIEDKYTYELNVEFETHVPKPVVIMEIDRDLTLLDDCETGEFNMIITNHGLVAAMDFSIIVPQSDYFVFTPLISHIDSFPAQTTYIIPVIYQRKDCAELGHMVNPGNSGSGGSSGSSDGSGNPGGGSESGYGSDNPSCYYCGVLCLKKMIIATYKYLCKEYYWERSVSEEIKYIEAPITDCLTEEGYQSGFPGLVIVNFYNYSPSVKFDTTHKHEMPQLIKICDPNLTPCQNALDGLLSCVPFIPLAVNSDGNVGLVGGEEAGIKALTEFIDRLLTRGFLSAGMCYASIIADIPNLQECLHSLTHNTTPDVMIRDINTFYSMLNMLDELGGKISPLYQTVYNDLLKSVFYRALSDAMLHHNVGDYLEGQIASSGRDLLLSRCLEVYNGSDVEDIVDNLIAVWNNSILAWSNRYLTMADAPIGYGTDFIQIDPDIIAEFYAHNNEAIHQGYIDIFDRYNSDLTNLIMVLQDYYNNQQSSSSLCASVTVQFSQTMTMTREAFEGTLTINNGHESVPMQNIDVDFVIRDENGVDCTNLFQVNFLSYNNMAGSNGSLALDAQNEGSIIVQFIPTKQAAPEIAKVYSFGGSFSFIDPFTGEFMTYNLYPVDIWVNPSPDLYVNYFMQRDIIGDDPLTEDRVEPIVPAELGVIIHNRGAGTAKNVLLETAEPQIIDNEKGLAIDFAMYGAAFNGNERQLGLMEIPFGNIEPGRTGVGEWWFTSTLLGHFVSYEAHVIHNNSFGNPDLSLVSSLDIHPLIHTVYAYGDLDDGINDFLVDDVEDIRNYPDSLYFSNGSRTGVATADSIGFDHYVTPLDTIVILTLDPSRIGWNYEQTWDPGRGQYKLISCTRNSDQQVIPLSNVWQSFVTLPVGADPIYENKLHIVDTLSSDLPTTYTLVFSLKEQVLEVDTILNIPESFITEPLSEVTVVFNKPIVDSTFNYLDMSLKCNNGANLLDENLNVEKLDSVTYKLHLNGYTHQSGYYVLNIQTLNITDVYGFNGYYGKQATWIQVITTCQPDSVSFADTACDSYTWNGTTYTQSGDYTQTFTATDGCDSVVTLHLTINFAQFAQFADTACDSYTWNGTTYTQSGDYTQTFTAADGCDSVVSLHLTINFAQFAQFADTACDSYTWNGTTYTQSGDYTQTFTAADGCDSVVSLHLTINFAQFAQFADTACDSYTWNGTTYTQSGDYTQTFTATDGCDSVVTLHITVNHGTYTETTVDTCGIQYYWALADTTVNQSGTYYHYSSIANDCTDTTVLILSLYQPVTTEISAQICEGEVYNQNGFNVSTAGDHQLNLQTFHGCDSTVILHLAVGSETVTYLSASICEGDNYNENGFEILAPAVGTQVYSDTIARPDTCDSVITLTLTVNAVTSGDTTAVVGNSFDWYGQHLTTTGDYTHTLTNSAGCDSVVTLHLTVNYTNTGDTTAVACDSFDWYEHTNLTQSGDYIHVFTNAAGGDSVVTLHLIVNHSVFEDISVAICGYFGWNDSIYTETGVYIQTFTATNGCDSVVTLDLIILEEPTMHAIIGEPEICINQYATYHYDISDPNYQYTTWIIGDMFWENVPVVTLHEESEGSVQITMLVMNQTGCFADTSLSVQVVNRIAPDTTEIRRKGNSNILVCQPVYSDYGQVHYRWGYTDLNTTAEVVMPGDRNYCLYDFGIDTLSYRYWVETYLNEAVGAGCENRSYYAYGYITTSTPDYVGNIVEAYLSNSRIVLYVSSLSPDDIMASLYDVNGKLLVSKGYGVTDQVSDMIPVSIAPGVYFLRVSIGGQLYSIKLLKI